MRLSEAVSTAVEPHDLFDHSYYCLSHTGPQCSVYCSPHRGRFHQQDWLHRRRREPESRHSTRSGPRYFNTGESSSESSKTIQIFPLKEPESEGWNRRYLASDLTRVLQGDRPRAHLLAVGDMSHWPRRVLPEP